MSVVRSIAQLVLALTAQADCANMTVPHRQLSVRQMVDLICARPEANWSRTEIMRRCGMSRNRIAKAFKDVCGMSLSALVRQRRIGLAQETMRDNPTMPFATIAEITGMRSHAAFCAAFRQETGKSPTEWRKSNERI
jgi:AraC family transcriptional regulator